MKIHRLLSEKFRATVAAVRSVPSSSLAPWAKALTGVALVALIAGCTEDMERQHSESPPPNYTPPPSAPSSPAHPGPIAPVSSGPTGHHYTTDADWAAAQWSTAYAGQRLSIPGFQKIFHDDFSDCSTITKELWQPYDAHKWTADDVGMGFLNIGVFMTSETAAKKGIPSPISCSQGHLTLTLSNPTRTPTGWVGAQIKTRSAYGYGDGYGLAQVYGYWEVDAMFPPLPPGFVPWASIWWHDRLATRPNPQTNELDLFETSLGTNIDGVSQKTTMHRFPADPLSNPRPELGQISKHLQKEYRWSYNIFDGKRHKWGLKRTYNWQIGYRDGIEIFRFPMTGDDMRTPFLLLIDNAINFKPTAPLTTTYSMHVYNVDIYSCPTKDCRQ